MPVRTKQKTSPSSVLAFNHAMVYSRDVAASLHFYADRLGLKVLEEFHANNRLVYARLKSPRGETTIALHMVAPGESLKTGGVRLYFEVKELDQFCKLLETQGVTFSQPPKVMPWGWRHAYLDDPDGHEVSLYWAGRKRLSKTKPAKSRKAGR